MISVNKKKYFANIFWSIVLFIALVSFDQLTKIMATEYLKDGKPFSIIKNIFEFNYLEGGNTGAAWGILSGQITFFVILSIIVTIVVSIFICKITSILCCDNFVSEKLNLKFSMLRIALIFLIAGAIGNMIDRILYKSVVDFIYIKIIDFPIFNIADCYVTMSVAFMIVLVMFVFKDEELSLLSKNKTDQNKTNQNKPK